MFKNEDECHFRNVAQDLYGYCNSSPESAKAKLLSDDEEAEKIEPASVVVKNWNSTKILANVQSNAFNLIT